jgi:hypothetical protein
MPRVGSREEHVPGDGASVGSRDRGSRGGGGAGDGRGGSAASSVDGGASVVRSASLDSGTSTGMPSGPPLRKNSYSMGGRPLASSQRYPDILADMQQKKG